MDAQKVISREYKLVLKTENFTGDESVLRDKTSIFWANFLKIIRPLIKTSSGTLDTINTPREIMFYDTNALTLYKKNYIFRERKDDANEKREVTLKFRHPDRYVSQDRDMEIEKNVEGKIKFEEDIKAPFSVLYSFSSTQPISSKKELSKLKQVIKLFPGLAEQLGELKEKEEIVWMNEPVKEIVITGGGITLCDDPLTEAECALIIWYDAKASSAEPLITEFSFRYGNKKGKLSKEAAQNAYDLFIFIEAEMRSWIDTESATKTGFIFNNPKAHH